MEQKPNIGVRGPLDLLLRTLSLRGFEEAYPTLVDRATKEGMSYESFLYELAKIEVERTRDACPECSVKNPNLESNDALISEETV
jgi:hypothetical protein